MLKRHLLLFLLLLGFTGLKAQPLIKVTGMVTNELQQPLSDVTVRILGQDQSSLTDEKGSYTIYAASTAFVLKYSLLGYKPVLITIHHDKAGRLIQDVRLSESSNELEQVRITSKQNQLSNSTTINIAGIPAMPSPSGNFEAILKTMPGVSANNELSGQYSVRGGNFDENLIYVNDIEINRPVLIRNGQQEGLSFINSDLLSSAKFSAGGFEARYGDKLSSVLDVKYGRPDSSQAVLTGGLNGASLSTKLLRQHGFLLAGLRYKNNTGVLGTQDNKGSYRPSFTDAQLIFQQELSPKLSLNFLGNLNSGTFKLIPESRQTEFGTLSRTIRLNVGYDGQEVDDYRTLGGAVTALYTPKPNLVVKWINSYFNSLERENINIQGAYFLRELSPDLVKPGAGGSATDKGTGGYFTFADNELRSQRFSSELKGDQTFNNHTFSWGLRFEYKNYRDELNEYSLIDSAGVNRFYGGPAIEVKNKLDIQYYSAYVQDSYRLSAHTDLQLGLRANYNSLSSQLLLSPRLLLAYRPRGNNKIFRWSAGVYQQAPDYRSIRDFQGQLNGNQKAQRSYNTSAGMDYAFDGLGTRLKFSTEAYFKYQDRLIPYMMDNVRIRYLAEEMAKGYTYGADFSIGGEFVKDLVSHFRLSLMQAKQQIGNDPQGFLKRPTDQIVNFSAYFQDRLLNSPTYKVHLNLLYGSQLPIGAPSSDRYTDNFHIPAYKRIDIGFSKDFLDDAALRKPGFLDKYFSSCALYAEVFNLLNIDNTVSYLWLKDLNNVQYAIPNYLTGRRINLKLIIKFKNMK
ncbi:Outer membrane receptor proteins, mostly Fe transport [Pedobacter steynii]|uniref:Outer membrane receptor proteins, mostly Fe transport n=1 Tax=Pedobacter steynii TaxID=430522 RepID=A0A1G9JRI9_9SPHI|nr:carboxypeptidase-like regulatory domain-containing protein [Pedobacter steynii]NQX38335.1 TonB-dependent receptor [Pedobacter steynii]SDL40210.1 Outer membrane receptor proteins, mostly Fe transport [Pedobacter steynii]